MSKTTTPRVSLRVLVLLLLCSSILCGTAGCTTLANFALLHPTHHRVQATGTRVEVPGSADEPPIETYDRRLGDALAKPDLFVLAFTGNAGRAEYLPAHMDHTFDPRLCGDLNIAVVGMQYPGYGAQPAGNADLAEAARCGMRTYQAVRARAGDTPVYIYGLSLGTAIALHIAANAGDQPPAGLILDRPPDLRGVIVGDHGWWNLWLAAYPCWWGVPSAADSVRNGGLVGAVPALFLLSSQDQVVRPVHQRRVADAYVGPKKIVWANCGHTGLISPRVAPDLGQGLRWLLSVGD